MVITFHPAFEGRYEDTLELYFHDVRLRTQFAITRRICATVGRKEDHELLKPKSPYTKKKSKPLKLEGAVFSYLRPPTWTGTKWRVSLPAFDPPKALIKTAFGPNGDHLVRRKFMPATFDTQTYGKHFQVMVHIEDEQKRCVSLAPLSMYPLQ
jgi:helicase MOV-10